MVAKCPPFGRGTFRPASREIKSGRFLHWRLQRAGKWNFRFNMQLNPQSILTLAEVREVLGDLKPRRGSHNKFLDEIIFRLTCCCGLHTTEIANLSLDDLLLEASRPAVRIKGKRTRFAPLWIDAPTRDALVDWIVVRRGEGAENADPVVESSTGRRFSQRGIYDRWKTAVRCLDEPRRSELSSTCGRWTFVAHALRYGLSQRQVASAAGVATEYLDRYKPLVKRAQVLDLFG